jgi:hypothetical protein
MSKVLAISKIKKQAIVCGGLYLKILKSSDGLLTMKTTCANLLYFY